jgi:hypothetical protein
VLQNNVEIGNLSISIYHVCKNERLIMSSKPAFSVDYDTGEVILWYQQPAAGVTLAHKWQEIIGSHTDYVLCLSGGLDSQLAASILSQLGIKYSACTYMLMWKDNVLNANDVLMAQRYCQRYGIELELVEHDYEQFLLDEQHLYYGETYKSNSPQIAFHLWFVHQLGNSRPIIMGGECPKISWMPQQKLSQFSYYHPAIYTQPFANLAAAHNLTVIRDPLRLDAETQYLSHWQYCSSVEQHKHYHELRTDAKDNNYQLRTAFYQQLATNLIPMLYKNHGFESLKTHMACETGIYNQFNLLYREPMRQHLARHDWQKIFSSRPRHRGDTKQLLNRHTELCMRPDVTSANTYRLDF